jgi:hypothetical protein
LGIFVFFNKLGDSDNFQPTWGILYFSTNLGILIIFNPLGEFCIFNPLGIFLFKSQNNLPYASVEDVSAHLEGDGK